MCGLRPCDPAHLRPPQALLGNLLALVDRSGPGSDNFCMASVLALWRISGCVVRSLATLCVVSGRGAISTTVCMAAPCAVWRLLRCTEAMTICILATTTICRTIVIYIVRIVAHTVWNAIHLLRIAVGFNLNMLSFDLSVLSPNRLRQNR